MSLTASEMTPADIAAVNGGGNSNGWGGDGAWWLIVLFLFAFAGNGWGNGFGNGGGGGNTYVIDNAVQRGFDQAAVINGLNGIQQAITAGNAATTQQAFAMQNQLAECCCENRLGIANLQAAVIAENCADREALNNGVRDIIANQTANTQAILDKMCQQELDAERRENQNLRTQLNMMNLAASQNAQTAQILADNAAQTMALEQYLNPTPKPAYVVQNPNCCQPQNSCGCGCGCGNF